MDALLVAFQLNALHRHHQRHLVEAARVLNRMTDRQRVKLGIGRWEPKDSYARVERLFVELCQVLESATTGFDTTWFVNALARASIPRDLLVSRTVAVDGTDLETWGRLQGTTVQVDLAGEAAESQLVEQGPPRQLTKRGKVKTARVLAIGPDGRNQYTKDPDARAGHRSAKGNRTSAPSSATNSTWLSRPATCAGRTTSTRPFSVTRFQPSTRRTHSSRPEPTAPRPSSRN